MKIREIEADPGEVKFGKDFLLRFLIEQVLKGLFYQVLRFHIAVREALIIRLIQRYLVLGLRRFVFDHHAEHIDLIFHEFGDRHFCHMLFPVLHISSVLTNTFVVYDMNTMTQVRRDFRVGKVAIVGRPNVGKSTLLNAFVQHKVAIISPKPQTTRAQIVAFFEDDRGQIFFFDTPGFYSTRAGVSHYNSLMADAIGEADLVLYVVDHTRDWGEEEERIWNAVSASEKPVLLILNKIDVPGHSFRDSYLALLEKRVKAVVPVSALLEQHVRSVIDQIFALLPVGVRDATVDFFPTPLLSQSSKEYLAELLREKVYLNTGQEVPYQTSARITSVDEDEEKNTLKIVGKIIVSDERYKGMLIGRKGVKIAQIRTAFRRELELATGKRVLINLQVVTNDE